MKDIYASPAFDDFVDGATEDQIKKFVRLLKKGIAYEIEDGIYYDIKKFKD
jgi:cysteinyl-tRNA synthetase